ncbi:MAG: alanine--tRNA ligase-related protein [Candidatus Karelsulcia muelleri]
MKYKDIKKIFLDFFNKKNHQIIDSASLLSKDDPSLMFTNAGMNRFKKYFLGYKNPKYDTYGLPFELANIFALKNNFIIDKFSFEKEMLKQKLRSKTKKKNIYV